MIYLIEKGLREMTKSEFRKKVIELLNKYQLNGNIKEKILPLFSIIDYLNQEEIIDVYTILEEAIITQKETERLTEKLKDIYSTFSNSVNDVSKRLSDIKNRLDHLKYPVSYSDGRRLPVQKHTKDGAVMKYNKQSFPGEKPNFGLKLNKLFSSYITEYGPEYITMVISDSILYTNSLILKISLKTQDVLIGSSKSLKIYETASGESFLITDKPEVIPYGNRKGFYFKYITYEDILNLTNGDFFKVFNQGIIDNFKEAKIDLPEELKSVGYYAFE